MLGKVRLAASNIYIELKWCHISCLSVKHSGSHPTGALDKNSSLEA